MAPFVLPLYVALPLRVGTDVAYVFKGFENLRRGRIDLIRRSWLLRMDGDLWRWVQEAVLARGGDAATRLAKLRAHQTAEQAANGNISETDRLGNSSADREAGEASWRHTDRVCIFVKAARARRGAYAALLNRAQIMMLLIDMEAAKNVALQERMGDCRAMKARARRKDTWLFQPIKWAQFGDSVPVSLERPWTLPAQWKGVDDFAISVHKYWVGVWVAPVENGITGAT